MFKNQQTLILDCAIKYLPDEVVRFHIFEKFLKDDEKKQYVTLSLRDMFIPNSLAILRETSLFRKRLYVMKNCNKYLFLKLVSMMIGFLMATGNFIAGVFSTFEYKDDKEYFKAFLVKQAVGVRIGDCILSTVLRLNGSKGLLARNFHFYKTWWKFIVSFFSATIFTRCLSVLYAGDKYFYSHETTYLDEAIRRILLNFGFREIRYDFFQRKAIVMPVLYGYEIRKRTYGRLNQDKSQFDLKLAEKKLRDLVYRNETYSYMIGADIDVTLRLDISKLRRWGDQRIAIIYLHAVSDAQYFYGIDCFIDLHDWLIETLRLLNKLGINTCIKMHPAYFNGMHNYPVDKEYLKTLEKIFGISIDEITPSIPTITKMPNVCFIHHSVSLLELSRVFPDFLCLTHHGTVATEAAYLEHAVICSSASPYIKNEDCFVYIYESLEEYESYIKKWVLKGGKPGQEQLKSLSVYIYTNYFLIKPENIALVLANTIGLKMSDLNYTSFNQKMGEALVGVSEENALYFKIESAVQEYV